MVELIRTPPDQKELKTVMSDLLKHGGRQRMANFLGVDKSDISHLLDPNNEDRKLMLVKGLREVAAYCAADPEAGEALRAYINGFFDSWTAGQGERKNLTTLACSLNQEVTDLMNARLEGKPLRDQLKEANDIGGAVARFVKHVEEEIKSGQLREVRK